MREIHKVICTVDYPEKYVEEIRSAFGSAEFIHVDKLNREAIRRNISGCDVAVLDSDLDDDILLWGKDLRWIQCCHAGLNVSAKPEVFSRGILLTGAGGRSSPVLAEHTIYFMLCACYHTRQQLSAQQNHHWGLEGSQSWRGLYGRTAGIFGMGNNGKMLASRLNAMGMSIITYDRSPVDGFDYIEKQLVSSNGDTPAELLRQSDFILLNLPLTDSTYHLMNRETFSQVKKGAVLVNMGRGGLVDTDAMLWALDEGILSCAGLDVFEQEPLSPESPLWERDDVYITPHCTPQVPDRAQNCVNIIRENIRRYISGEKLLNVMEENDVYTK